MEMPLNMADMFAVNYERGRRMINKRLKKFARRLKREGIEMPGFAGGGRGTTKKGFIDALNEANKSYQWATNATTSVGGSAPIAKAKPKPWKPGKGMNSFKSILDYKVDKDLPRLFQAYARKLMAEGGIELPSWMDLSEMLGNWFNSDPHRAQRFFREDYTLVQEYLDDQWPQIIDAIKAGPPAAVQVISGEPGSVIPNKPKYILVEEDDAPLGDGQVGDEDDE